MADKFGVHDKRCLKLAALASTAVDFPKTGKPTTNQQTNKQETNQQQQQTIQHNRVFVCLILF